MRAAKDRIVRRGMSFAGIALAAVLVMGAAGPAHALDQVKVGKAVAFAWTFLPLDVGIREGLFKKYGLDVQYIDFAGDAKLQQGLVSDSIQLGLGSGPGMAFAVKGSPVVAVAAYAGAPRNISIIVGAHSPIKSVRDLKGKKIAVSTAGSLTAWLVHHVSRAEGWGTDGITAVPTGGFQAQLAALIAHEVDGMMGATEGGYTLEAKGKGHILVGMDKFVPVFITHVVFAQKALVAKNPDLVRRFLDGFFAAIAFERTHKAETSKIAEEVLHLSPKVANETYDYEMPMLSKDGTFNPKAVAILKKSFVEMGTLQHEPKNSQLFTTKFVPVKLPAGPAEAAR